MKFQSYWNDDICMPAIKFNFIKILKKFNRLELSCI